MREKAQALRRSARGPFLAVIAFLAVCGTAARAQELAFQLDPQRTTVNFTLGDVLHTVRGSFDLKQGSLHFNPASGKMVGEIVVDAKSGASGTGMRDRKMHREVLESDRYPDISFRPDHVDGTILLQGKSSVRVHGMFAIHGAEHELTAPADVEISSERWTATVHFSVPYTKWGMKNPSTLFLRVSESVDIDLTASGTLTQP